MARQLRSNRPDGWYHAFHRGIERRAIYRDDVDRRHFLELLGEMHERFRIRIHAYCLMDNHYHSVLQTPDANLSEAMQWLHLSHAAWFNARHRRVGALWQGRFRSVPVENSAWSFEVGLYVHLNPVRTEEFGLGRKARRLEGRGLSVPDPEEVRLRLKALREYRWSSYRAYAGHERGPDWLSTKDLLSHAGGAGKKGCAAYRMAAKQRLASGVEEPAGEKLCSALAIGGKAFVRKVIDGAKGGHRESRGKRSLRRRTSFDEVVAAVVRLRDERWSKMVGGRGNAGRPLVMWAARKFCGMTLAEIGECCGGKDYAAVSIAIKRFEARAATDRTLRRQMKELPKLLNVEM